MSQHTHSGPCSECGSRDNVGWYDDGHGYCFGCGTYFPGEAAAPRAPERKADVKVPCLPPEALEALPLSKRGITQETCQKFSYYCSRDAQGKRVHVATFCDDAGRPVAQKVRRQGKVFSWRGDKAAATPLFGQHLWSQGGRRLIITEGEIDALSMSQAQGNRWPVVSVPDGAQSAVKAVQRAAEFVDSFDEVVLMFDMDEPGRAAAAAVAEVITPGKAFIADLPHKDPNEVLLREGAGVLSKLHWQARRIRPDGIVLGEELWDLVAQPLPNADAQYPFRGLNDVLLGARKGEIVTFTAGSGIGKSTTTREIAWHLLQKGEKVGMVALEESLRRTVEGFMSLSLNVPLHLRGTEVTADARRAAFDAVNAHEGLRLYDHWGSLDANNLWAKLRAMVKGFGVQWIVLDHISIVVSGNESTNERKELDIAMTNLRSMVEELQVGCFVVSHLKRTDRAFELGGQVRLSDLRGSAALEQLSDAVVALERNQQHEEHSTMMTVRVLKNRFAGTTGVAGWIEYNRETGRLVEHDADPFASEEEERNPFATGQTDFE